MSNFRPRIHIRFRRLIILGIWLISAVGVVVAFFTLSSMIAVPLALLGVLIPWVCSRFLYRVPIIWVMPMTSAKTFYNRLGVALYRGQYRDRGDVPGIGLVYENRFAAKEAYSVIRSWNFGRYIDEHRNIHVSFVREGEGRYMFYIYPGERMGGRIAIEETAQAEHADIPMEADVTKFLMWTSTPIDCAAHPEKEPLIESLPAEPYFLLNTLYGTKDGLKSYAKRPIVLTEVAVASREDLPEGCIEFHNGWFDGKLSDPAGAARCAELETLTKT